MAGPTGVEPGAPAAGEAPADLGSEASKELPVSGAPTAEPAGQPARRPSRFLADLARAMQAAAEQARAVTLEQFRAEGAAAIEQIHGRSASSAAELRRRADEDAATIKEWSKGEIARIREETERRITARREQFEGQLERHAALVEHDIEQVRRRIASFEETMGRFFDDLLREDDPARFAVRAANLPEPPSFASPDEGAMQSLLAEPGLGLPAPATAAEAAASSAIPAAGSVAEPVDVPPVAVPDAPAEPFDREAAMAAIQAAAEAAASAESAASAEDAGTIETAETAEAAEAAHGDEAIETAETVETIEGAEVGAAALAAQDVPPLGEPAAQPSDEPAPDIDARLAALGLSQGFAAAEAAAAQAAAAAVTPSQPGEGDPASGDASPETVDTIVTQVVTTGLVSVASIASFKRHLGRLAGVVHVGVSSGPDGEFVFAVEHDPPTPLRDLIPTVPGFAARVVGGGEGTLQVSARDPQD
jgi:hypothetical protein